MSNKAMRDNQGKPQLRYWAQFPRSAEALSRVMEYGATKYEEGNWAKGGKPDSEYLDAAMRHITKMMRYYHTNDESDLYDEESGCHHLGHILFNLGCLVDVNNKSLPITKPDQILNIINHEVANK